MSHLILGENVAFVSASRLSSKGFNHILPADCLVEMKYASHDTNSRVFPAMLYENSLLGSDPRPNFGKAATEIFGGKVKPSDWTELNEALFAFLNSTHYRIRFIDEIKNDFPGIPPLTDSVLRRHLAKLGKRLIRAQLLKTELAGSVYPFNGKVGEPIKVPKMEGNRIWITDSGYFDGISMKVFEFNLAGYQVCKNWVSAGNKSGIQRKGTFLTDRGVESYRHVLFAIQETIEIRGLIDQTLTKLLGWESPISSLSPSPLSPTPSV